MESKHNALHLFDNYQYQTKSNATVVKRNLNPKQINLASKNRKKITEEFS